jgi:hypothetical protein
MPRAPLALAASLACACGAPGGTGDSGAWGGFGGAMAAPAACALTPSGDPVPVVSFANRHATAPSMLVLDTGASGDLASVAISVFANAGVSGLPDDIEITRVSLGVDWPATVVVADEPQLLGESALGPGYLAQPLSAPSTLGLAWHRDDAEVGRPQFRALDVTSWEQGPDVQIAPSGDAVFSFVAGAGVDGAGNWSGDGFAISWRDVAAPGAGPARPLAALLDPAGKVVRRPTPLAPGENYPGRAPTIVWTGSEYLVATTYDDCADTDLCAPRSVVVARMVASGDPSGGLSLQPVTALSALGSTAVPGGSATMASLGGRVWVVWTEGAKAEAGSTLARAVRLAALDAHGQLLAPPLTVASDAHPASRVAISASDAGILLTWAENALCTDGGDLAADVLAGASFVVVERVGYDGSIDAPVRIAATRIDDYGPPTSAAIASPRGALVLWAGQSTVPGPGHFDVTYMARLACDASVPAR